MAGRVDLSLGSDMSQFKHPRGPHAEISLQWLATSERWILHAAWWDGQEWCYESHQYADTTLAMDGAVLDSLARSVRLTMEALLPF